jgi:hypothetical protein
MANEEQSAPESRTPLRAEGVNKAPNQWEEGNRRRKAFELADFFRRRGITDAGLQTMHPAILEHHIRSAGLKSPPSAETMKLVAQHLKPQKPKPADYDPFEGL